MQPSQPVPARARAPALFHGGLVVLAFAALLAVLSLSSAELENPDQAGLYGTAAFVVGAIGALAALVGAFLRARA